MLECFTESKLEPQHRQQHGVSTFVKLTVKSHCANAVTLYSSYWEAEAIDLSPGDQCSEDFQT